MEWQKTYRVRSLDMLFPSIGERFLSKSAVSYTTLLTQSSITAFLPHPSNTALLALSFHSPLTQPFWRSLAFQHSPSMASFGIQAFSDSLLFSFNLFQSLGTTNVDTYPRDPLCISCASHVRNCMWQNDVKCNCFNFTSSRDLLHR